MTTPFTCQVLCLLIKIRIMLCEWNKYCPWAKYCEHWSGFNSVLCNMEAPNSPFSAIWTVHSLDNPKQRAVWWLHCNFWRDTMSTSRPAPAVPLNHSPVASQAHPQLQPGWRWDRQRQNQVLTPHQRSKGTQEAATAWHHLQAHSLILESQKHQLHIPLLNSLCHYSFCMVLPDEVIEHCSCQPFSHSLAPPTINLLLLKCLWQ